jgi:hypothetical protein
MRRWEPEVAHFCFLLLEKAVFAELKLMFAERKKMMEEEMLSEELRRSEQTQEADLGAERHPSLGKQQDSATFSFSPHRPAREIGNAWHPTPMHARTNHRGLGLYSPHRAHLTSPHPPRRQKRQRDDAAASSSKS